MKRSFSILPFVNWWRQGESGSVRSNWIDFTAGPKVRLQTQCNMNHSSLSTKPNKRCWQINDQPYGYGTNWSIGRLQRQGTRLSLELETRNQKKTTEGGMDKNKDKYITIDLQDNMRYSSKRCIETTPVSEDTFQYNNSHSFHDHERTTVASCVCEWMNECVTECMSGTTYILRHCEYIATHFGSTHDMQRTLIFYWNFPWIGRRGYHDVCVVGGGFCLFGVVLCGNRAKTIGFFHSE